MPIDLNYYRAAWPLREQKENGEVVDLVRSENVIKHYEDNQAALDDSTNSNPVNGNTDYPFSKEDLDDNGQPKNRLDMRDDGQAYNYFEYTGRYRDIATLPPKEAKAHWTSFGNSSDVNKRKGRDLLIATVDETAETITLKMPVFRQQKVRVILKDSQNNEALLGVNKTYTLVIERPDNFGDAYLLSGDEIEILFKYTNTTAESDIYAVVQTKKTVTDTTQFDVQLDRLDGDYYLMNTAPTKNPKESYVYQYVKFYYIEDGTQNGVDGFWSTQRLQIQQLRDVQLQDVVSFKAIDTRECKFEYVVPGLMNYGAHQYNTTLGPKYAYPSPSENEVCKYYVTTISGTNMQPSHLIGFDWQTGGGAIFNSGTIVGSADTDGTNKSLMLPPERTIPTLQIDLAPENNGDFQYVFGIIDLFQLVDDGGTVSGNHHLIQIYKEVDDQIEINVNGKNLGGSDHDPNNMPRGRATVVTGRYLYFNLLYLDKGGDKKCLIEFQRKNSW